MNPDTLRQAQGKPDTWNLIPNYTQKPPTGRAEGFFWEKRSVRRAGGIVSEGRGLGKEESLFSVKFRKEREFHRV